MKIYKKIIRISKFFCSFKFKVLFCIATYIFFNFYLKLDLRCLNFNFKNYKLQVFKIKFHFY